MAGLLATQIVTTLAHRLYNVAVTDICLYNFSAALAKSNIKPHVAHDSCHKSFFPEQLTLQHVSGTNCHDVVAIDLVAELVVLDHLADGVVERRQVEAEQIDLEGLGNEEMTSDDLSSLTWRPGFKDPRFIRGREVACNVIGKLCSTLAVA